MLDYELLQYSPSIIGVACVVAARGLCGLAPVWTPQLEFITSYDFDQIAGCHSLLTRYSSSLTSSLCISQPLVSADTSAMSSHEKVLELNQNIGNRLPTTRPATTKATKVPPTVQPLPMARATFGERRANEGMAKAQQKEEHFNIKAKKVEMENMKQSIKDKLVALNNKSRSIETLLEEDRNTSTNLAFMSYRAPMPSQGPFNRDLPVPQRSSQQLRPLPSFSYHPQLSREPGFNADATHAFDHGLNLYYERTVHVPPGHIEFLQPKTRERPGQMHRPNSSFNDTHLHTFHPRVSIDKDTDKEIEKEKEKEKENAQSKLAPGYRTTKAATSRDIGSLGSMSMWLKQRSMRI